MKFVIQAVAVFAALGLVAAVPAADEPNPIVTMVKGAVKDTGKPFTLVVSIQVKDGMQEKFETAFAKAIKASRKEKGCLAYDLNHDLKDSTKYVVYERWKSLGDLEDHLKSSHFATLMTETKDVFDGAPQGKVLLPAAE